MEKTIQIRVTASAFQKQRRIQPLYEEVSFEVKGQNKSKFAIFSSFNRKLCKL